MRRLVFLAMTAVLALGLLAAPAAARDDADGPNPRTQVYVASQGLVYDSIVLTDLPPNGPFQELKMGGPVGLYTEHGPGDPGYVGGRWWVDVNNNDVMDEGDHYFLCPLLGPGHAPA